MKTIRGLSGFGDNIYMRVIMEWLLENEPADYTILSNFPDIFRDMSVKVEKYNRSVGVDYSCTYLRDKRGPNTQFQDLLNSVGFPIIPFTSKLKSRTPKGYTIVIPPYSPMGGYSGSRPMQPLEEEYSDFIKQYKNVKILTGKHPFRNLVNIFNSADLVISQVGWAVPMSEMLDVPLIAVFTRRALEKGNSFISAVTPNKIKEKESTTIKIME